MEATVGSSWWLQFSLTNIRQNLVTKFRGMLGTKMDEIGGNFGKLKYVKHLLHRCWGYRVLVPRILPHLISYKFLKGMDYAVTIHIFPNSIQSSTICAVGKHQSFRSGELNPHELFILSEAWDSFIHELFWCEFWTANSQSSVAWGYILKGLGATKAF